MIELYQLLPSLKSQLTKHEGLSLFPYKDSTGHITIGIGHNLEAKGLPQFVVDYLFQVDVTQAIDDLNEQLPWVGELNTTRQRVLVDMCFNLGIGKLLEFHNTLNAIRLKDWDAAATHMLNSLWAKQVGARAVTLAQMMRTGLDPE